MSCPGAPINNGGIAFEGHGSTKDTGMKHHYISLLAVGLSMIALLNGCAGGPDYRSPPTGTDAPPSYSNSNTGVVEEIEVSHQDGSGVGGTIVGGAVGGLLGNQIGSGSGRTAATVAGAVGGAVVGNQVQKIHGGREVYNIRVRMNDGSMQSFVQDSTNNLRVGDPVRLDGGRVYRY